MWSLKQSLYQHLLTQCMAADLSEGAYLESASNGGLDALILEPLLDIRVSSLHQAVLLQQACQVRPAHCVHTFVNTLTGGLSHSLGTNTDWQSLYALECPFRFARFDLRSVHTLLQAHQVVRKHRHAHCCSITQFHWMLLGCILEH